MNTALSIVLWVIYIVSLYFVIFWFIVYLQGGATAPKRKKIIEYPFISVIIPAYNEEKHIATTIRSVFSLDYPKNRFELIVIDDGSSDNTYALAKSIIDKHPKFNTRLITKKNGGKGTAMNMALKIAKGEYFVCLDGDSHIESSAVKKMLPYFSSDDIASVLPCMKVSNPKNFLEKIQWYEYIVNMYYKKIMGHLDCVFVAPGPFSMFKTDVLRTIGGFKEDNLTEDLEITLRLQQHHYRIIQVLDVYVYTNVPDTLKKLYHQRNRWFKGSFFNAIAYRKMIFNSEYGDFGLMQLPLILVSGLMSMILVLSAIYYFLQPKLTFIKNLSYVNFDIWTFITNIQFNYYLIDKNFSIILISLFTFMLSMTVLYLAHKHTKERIFRQGALPLFAFIFLFYLYLGFVWCRIMIDLTRGKVQKW